MSTQVLETTTHDTTDGELRYAQQPEPVHVVERTKDGRMFWVVDANQETKVVQLASRTGRRRFVDETTLLANYRPLRKVSA